MRRIFVAGVALAAGSVVISSALHLLNQPSDAAVAFGYLILLMIVSLAVGVVPRLLR